MSVINMKNYVKEMDHLPMCVVFMEAMDSFVEEANKKGIYGDNSIEEGDYDGIEIDSSGNKTDLGQESIRDDRNARY